MTPEKLELFLRQRASEQAASQRQALGIGVLLLCIGATMIALSVRTGRHVTAAGLLYDLGIAAVTIAMLEVMLSTALRAIAHKNAELLRFMEQMDSMQARIDKDQADSAESRRDLQMKSMAIKVESTEQKLDRLYEALVVAPLLGRRGLAPDEDAKE